jgi:hypothetical protein
MLVALSLDDRWYSSFLASLLIDVERWPRHRIRLPLIVFLRYHKVSKSLIFMSCMSCTISLHHSFHYFPFCLAGLEQAPTPNLEDWSCSSRLKAVGPVV